MNVYAVIVLVALLSADLETLVEGPQLFVQ